MLLLSAVLDMLDGALARAGQRQSDFGAVLDSTLDRVAELAVYVGCAAHFALRGNATFAALSLVAFGASFLVSYTKARIENFGVPCRVGYWQRGERLVLFAAAGQTLGVDDLPETMRAPTLADGERVTVGVGMTMAEVERRMIAATYSACGRDKRLEMLWGETDR